MSKSNISYIITYIEMLVFFILGGIFFRQSFIAIIVILLLVLPIISVFLLRISLEKIELITKCETSTVSNDNPIVLNVGIVNKGFLPLLNCNVYFNYNNIYYPNDEKHCLSIPALPRKPYEASITFDVYHLGINEFKFTTLEVTDFLHLYSIKLPLKNYIEVPVMPISNHKIDSEEEIVIPPLYAAEDDEQFVNYGQPTHDLKETREYHPGDSLKDIHWKLTAKNDAFTVKVFEQSAERTLVIVPELCNEETDITINTLYSFSEMLLREREFFKIAVFSAYEYSFNLITINTIDDLDNAILALYHSNLYDMKQYALNSFFEIYGSEKGLIHILKNKITFVNGAIGEKTTVTFGKEGIDNEE